MSDFGPAKNIAILGHALIPAQDKSKPIDLITEPSTEISDDAKNKRIILLSNDEYGEAYLTLVVEPGFFGRKRTPHHSYLKPVSAKNLQAKSGTHPFVESRTEDHRRLSVLSRDCKLKWRLLFKKTIKTIRSSIER